MLLASFGLKAFRKKLNLPHVAESHLEASFWYGGGPLMSGGVRRQSHEGVAGYPCLMDYYVKLHVR